MRAVVTLTVVYENERLLVLSEMKGAPSNLVDVSAQTADEIEWALGMVTRSIRRQILEKVVAGAHPE